MQKAKKYDWKDSNMALFGSDTEKSVKKESAQGEPAWQKVDGTVGIRVWRIVNFKVEEWPKEQYGTFYNGDSYIVLNTYKDNDEIKYDVHFWIGAHSSQDEYGTAAYKTVELDTYLDDVPIQHRQVQGHESELFLTYFSALTILKGGADSGFRQVKPEEYQSRLLQIVGHKKNVEVIEIPAKKGNLNSEDVFVLDMGLNIYQFNGKTANKDEKFKATQYVQQLRSERGGKPNLEILDESDLSPDHPFFTGLGEGASKSKDAEVAGPKKLFKLSNEDGSLDMDEVTYEKSSLKSDDVFIVDNGSEVFVWIGSGASIDEKRNGMGYAHKYLMGTSHPLAPITVLSEGKESSAFNASF